MPTTSAPETQSTQAHSLAEAVRQFVSRSKPSDALEQHHRAVIELRSRGATYSQIFDLLQAHGVLVSEPAIIRFCHKHRAELKRRRIGLEQEPPPSPNSSPEPSTLIPMPVPPGRFRDLRGPV